MLHGADRQEHPINGLFSPASQQASLEHIPLGRSPTFSPHADLIDWCNLCSVFFLELMTMTEKLHFSIWRARAMQHPLGLRNVVLFCVPLRQPLGVEYNHAWFVRLKSAMNTA